MDALLYFLLVIAIVGGLALGAIVIWIAVRIRVIVHKGAFNSAYRPLKGRGVSRWAQGLTMFSTHELRWYRLFSLNPKPSLRWNRRDIELFRAEAFKGAEGINMQVPVQVKDEKFMLFMSADDHAALVSWVEAAPPIPLPNSWCI